MQNVAGFRRNELTQVAFVIFVDLVFGDFNVFGNVFGREHDKFGVTGFRLDKFRAEVVVILVDFLFRNFPVNHRVPVVDGYVFEHFPLGFGRGRIFFQNCRNVETGRRILHQILLFQIAADGVYILLFAPVGLGKEIVQPLSAELTVIVQELNLRENNVAYQSVADGNFVFRRRFFGDHGIQVPLHQSGQHLIADFVGNFNVAEQFLRGSDFLIQLLVDIKLAHRAVVDFDHRPIAGSAVDVA